MRKILMMSALAAAIAMPAYAHDHGFIWEGSYAGAHLGGTFSNSNRAIDLDYYNSAIETTQLKKEGSFTGGIQAGHNWQIDNIVLGAEADFSLFGINNRGQSFIQPDTDYTAKTNWQATFRLRGGVLVTDDMLVYATGGLALGRVRYEVIDDCDTFPCGGDMVYAAGKRNLGYTVGGGIEHAISPEWSIKGEYLYTHYQGRTVSGESIIWGDAYDFHFNRFSTHTVRVGVNYHL